MQAEKKFLEKSFQKLKIVFFPSKANFYLLKTDNADKIFQRFRNKGILLGNCSGYRGLDDTYLRVAVRSHKENALFIKTLTAIYNGSIVSEKTEQG